MASESEMLEWFEDAWFRIQQRASRESIASWPDADRVLFLVGSLIDGLVGGGPESVFYNPSGAYVNEMPDALAMIGAAAAAQVIRDINAMFPGGAPASDETVRSQQLKNLPDSIDAKAVELEAVFDEWLPDHGGRVMLKQLYDYCHRH